MLHILDSNAAQQPPNSGCHHTERESVALASDGCEERGLLEKYDSDLWEACVAWENGKANANTLNVLPLTFPIPAHVCSNFAWNYSQIEENHCTKASPNFAALARSFQLHVGLHVEYHSYTYHRRRGDHS